jgi:hypothetical protein
MSEIPKLPTQPTPETAELLVAPSTPADIFPTPSPAFGPGYDVAAVRAHRNLMRALPGEISNPRTGLNLASQPETPREAPTPGKHAAETILPDFSQEKRRSLVTYMGRRVLQKFGIRR